MAGLRFAVLFCVFLIQRAASQCCSCQSELYISMDDLVNAIKNGPGFPGIAEPNQQSCCNQQSCSNQQSCGNQLSYGNQLSCGNQLLCGNQQPCGCNQQSQPSISISNRPISLGQVTQPLSISSIPSSNNQQCGCQPSISFSQLPQQCGCQPSVLISQSPNQCGCQPSVSISQPSNQCGCQPSVSISQSSNQCGCQPSVSISQPSNQCGCQPSVSISQPSNQCGCQPSVSISQPSNQCGCQPQQSLTISNPSISFQPVSSGQCGQQIQLNNVQSRPQSQVIQVPEVAACMVPAALLQAPPYGIVFAGENLLIDGAVQVCGNMPFNSIVEFSGLMPSSGSGCVEYVCDDTC